MILERGKWTSGSKTSLFNSDESREKQKETQSGNKWAPDETKNGKQQTKNGSDKNSIDCGSNVKTRL